MKTIIGERKASSVSVDAAKRTVSGMAIVYDQRAYVGGGLYETIAFGAASNIIGAKDEQILCLLEHNPELLLGSRADGTLQLKETPQGVWFQVTLPDTSYARDLAACMSRDPSAYGASFRFTCKPGNYSIDPTPSGEVQTIQRLDSLAEVSITCFPAYGRDVTKTTLHEDTADASAQRSTRALATATVASLDELKGMVDYCEVRRRV